MNSEMKKAYSELYEILQLLDDEFVDKIPKKIIEFISKEKDDKYIANINPNIPLEEQNLLSDTINILAMLKLDYWCENENEKQELLNILNENERKYQEELNEKYNPENIFKNRNNTSEEEKIEITSMVVVKEKNFILKLLDKIRNMFKK